MRRVAVWLLTLGLSLAPGTAVAGADAGVAAAAAAPDRVQILQARRLPHAASLKWEAAPTGSRPRSYQVRLGRGRWKATKRTAYKVKRLKAGRGYRIRVRAVRKRPGPSVLIRLFPVR